MQKGRIADRRDDRLFLAPAAAMPMALAMLAPMQTVVSIDRSGSRPRAYSSRCRPRPAPRGRARPDRPPCAGSPHTARAGAPSVDVERNRRRRGLREPAAARPARTSSGDSSPTPRKVLLALGCEAQRADLFFQRGLELLHHEQAVDGGGEVADDALRAADRRAELQDEASGDLLDVEIGRRAGDDAEAARRLSPSGSAARFRDSGRARPRARSAWDAGGAHWPEWSPSFRRVDEALGGDRPRAPTRTALRVCERRVVERTITGVSKSSEISKASLVKSCASCASDGSSTGTLAKRANRRVSCSFCEEWMPGSSQTTSTRPPCAPI